MSADAAVVDSDGWPISLVKPRARVICDNDLGGDPDGLVQLAHHLLSPSVDLCAVLTTHHISFRPEDSVKDTPVRGAEAARKIAALCGRDDVRVIPGDGESLTDRTTPVRSHAALAIVAEAMREDTDLPLFVACGAGLTAIASAWLIEPAIASRLTVVWIGGHEHDGLADVPPGAPDMEYNLGIDPIAGQVVFNDSDLVVWQIPRDMYRTVMATRAEMLVRMRPMGELGRHLFDSLAAVIAMTASLGMSLGETYVLGDSPLVGLTVHWTAFEPSPASSFYITVPCPRILDGGLYEENPDGKPLRVYVQIDNRTLLEDLYAKLELHAQGLR